jgi:hypothetical protein
MPADSIAPTLATVANMRRLEGAGDRDVFAFSPTTGEQYSATAGDYWNRPDDEPLTGEDGEPMVLARRIVRYVDALTGDTL